MYKENTMNMVFDINRSLKANPPNYGPGIEWIERKAGRLEDLVTMDSEGVSLQPREKEKETGEDLKTSFKTHGVLYDREVMVVEKREDEEEELQSGFNRWGDLGELGVERYFWDLIRYESPFYKALWKRRFNASLKDHLAKGIPNKSGDYMKGLEEAVGMESFNWQDDGAVIDAIDFMANGSKDSDQIEGILKKFRKTKNPNPNVVALDTPKANKILEGLGLPYNGYIKDASKNSYGKIGFSRWDGNFQSFMCKYVDLYDFYHEPINIYGFIEFLVAEQVTQQRQNFLKHFQDSVDWAEKHLNKKYHEIFHFIGFLAQITTPNPLDGGKRKERGIVDVNGEIIIDTPLGI